MKAPGLDLDVEPRRKAKPRKPTRAPDCACTAPTAGVCRGAWDVVLIGCGSEKAAVPTTAADLYTGSLYAAHRRILTHLGTWPPTAILSAEHGWLMPEQVIEPYKKHIDDLTAEELETWGDRVASRLYAQHLEKPVVLVLAGGAYIDPWLKGCSGDWEGISEEIRDGLIVVDDPLRGLEVGERLQFAADLVAAGPIKKSPRCSFHAFTRKWRAQLEERRAGRRVAAERERRASADQLDMFGGAYAA